MGVLRFAGRRRSDIVVACSRRVLRVGMKESPFAGLVVFVAGCGRVDAQQGQLLVTQKGDEAWRLSIRPPARCCFGSEGGVTGHEVVASPDGRLAYVPIYGNSGVGKPGTDGTNMVVIDLASQKMVGNVDFGHGVRPHMPIFGPKDGLLYVTTELDQTSRSSIPRR